jgi:hypothetical protein
MPRRDAKLLRAPTELPQRAVLAFGWDLGGIVIAGEVAPAQEGIRKPILYDTLERGT